MRVYVTELSRFSWSSAVPQRQRLRALASHGHDFLVPTQGCEELAIDDPIISDECEPPPAYICSVVDHVAIDLHLLGCLHIHRYKTALVPNLYS